MTGAPSADGAPGRAPPWYTVKVDLLPGEQRGRTDRVYALVKFTFRIQGGRLRLADAEPLAHPIPGEGDDPPLPPGTDFFPWKPYTDVVVQGSAFAPGGRPTARSQVSLQVGEYTRSIAVFGRREVGWDSAGKLRIGEPEPFDEIPLTWENAYGGVDPRVPAPEPVEVPDFLLLQRDHPGLYPRNPFGRGYLAHPDPLESLEMPNLEDPTDLLTPERLVVQDPTLWYLQPIPACFDFVSVGAFPRQVFFSAEAQPWFPAPEDERLPEVARGFLMPGYRSYMAEGNKLMAPLFFQAASHGFIFADLPPGTSIRIAGMHPEFPELHFTLPSVVPLIRLLEEDRALEGEPRLHHVVCRPADLTVNMVYGVRSRSNRTYLPGIHAEIPLAVQVGSEAPIPYFTPPPTKAP